MQLLKFSTSPLDYSVLAGIYKFKQCARTLSKNYILVFTLESRIIVGAGIIGVLDIVIITNNKGGGGGGRGWENSVGGFLVLIC